MDQFYHPNLGQELCRWAYSGLLLCLLPVLLLHFAYHYLRRCPGYSSIRLQRFGFRLRTAQPGGILIHCVSVGEVVAAANVLKTLRAKQPNLPITLTTTTATGAQRAQDLFGEQITHCYLPYDIPFMMCLLLSRSRPSQVLITEVELWPNLIHHSWYRGIPVSVINARMTPKSAKSYAKISLLFHPMLCKLSAICAQGQRDYTNYLALGAPSESLFLTNNIKFAQRADDQALRIAKQISANFGINQRPVLVAGSTHEPEESMLLAAFQGLLKEHPELLLIIVPRHPERFDTVYELCESSGLECTRSSTGTQRKGTTQVLLVDQMGLLQGIYALAHIAFVGGSIAKRGGHNALEPAAFGVPVLMGPHIFNNPEICQTLAASGALFSVRNVREIYRQTEYWLANPTARLAAGEAGKQVLIDNSGAVEATLKVLQL